MAYGTDPARAFCSRTSPRMLTSVAGTWRAFYASQPRVLLGGSTAVNCVKRPPYPLDAPIGASSSSRLSRAALNPLPPIGGKLKTDEPMARDAEDEVALPQARRLVVSVKALSQLLIRLLNLLAVDDRSLTRCFPFRLSHMRRAVPKTNAPFQGVAATTLQLYSAAPT